jgi:hypothetical protein
MPSELLEHQLEILDANDETRALLFGTEGTGYLTLAPPAWVAGDTRAGDVDRPQEDGRYFGRDLRSGASVNLEIGVITDHLATPDSNAYRTNVDHLDTLQSWWDDERLRQRPWDLAVLRQCVAGRTSRAYGRPRRYDEAAGRLQQQGYTPVVCDFAVIDNRVYDDAAEQVNVPLVNLPEGGLITPLVAPLTTTGVTTGERVAVIGGSRATWPWVEFRGPVLNPKVQIGPLTIGLAASIPDEMSVTVDPRPWSRGVTRNDGANYAGYLSHETPVLRELTIRPGTYPVVYSGTDATGTSECVVYWRGARSRP